MKSLLIETVTNGWIVRPFQPSSDWCVGERDQIAVYTKIEDLQRELPKLLTFESCATVLEKFISATTCDRP